MNRKTFLSIFAAWPVLRHSEPVNEPREWHIPEFKVNLSGGLYEQMKNGNSHIVPSVFDSATVLTMLKAYRENNPHYPKG
jgi:hypothetical protein